ncbi:unnamed protein product, partial [Heterosigma akashiwo]
PHRFGLAVLYSQVGGRRQLQRVEHHLPPRLPRPGPRVRHDLHVHADHELRPHHAAHFTHENCDEIDDGRQWRGGRRHWKSSSRQEVFVRRRRRRKQIVSVHQQYIVYTVHSYG